jgi:hypothetical protein
MPNPRQLTKKNDKSLSGARIAIITTLITALVGLISTMLVVFFQYVFPTLVNLKFTQTAASIKFTQTVQAETSNAPTPIPSVMPILIFYANVNLANVYEGKDEASRVFDIVVRCTKVEVVSGGYDPDWLHVTYPKGNARYTGYVITKQFTEDPSACQSTNLPTP